MTRNLPAVFFVFLAFICGAVFAEVDNPCERGIDLGFIVDRSKSVGTTNYKKLKSALTTFVDKFNVTPETTHMSMILYADEPLLLFNFSDARYYSNDAIKKKIKSVKDTLFLGTRTDLALMRAHDVMFHWANERSRRPNVLLVFTDGQTARGSAPYSEVVPPLEDKGVNIIAVGIGKRIKNEELEKIAGERGSTIQVADFDALSEKLNQILARVCIINGGYTLWSTWSECSATCGDGIRTRFRNCTNPEPEGGGKNCDDIGPPEEQEACDLPDCDASIDGGYTRWTTWGLCTKTCGGGVQIRARSCTNPPPFNNGKNCDHLGEPIEEKSCNTKKCKPKPAPCRKGIDLGIAVDHSTSIRPKNLLRLLENFMPALIAKIGISQRKTHIGFIKYSKEATVLVDFKNKISRSVKLAKSFFKYYKPKNSFRTRTDLGLKAAYEQLFTRKYGDRPGKQNVLLTFTDGRTYPRKFIHGMLKVVSLLKSRRKCHMVAVGYGVPRQINMTQLQEIAADNVFKVDKPKRISEIVQPITNIICNVDGGYSEWSTWSMCSATCGAGVKLRSRVCNSPPPRQGGKNCTRLGDPFEIVECNEGDCQNEPTPCDNNKFDVCLIVDSSSSVKIGNYVKVKTFLVQFIYHFQPGTHFSLITFSAKPNVRCNFVDPRCQTAEDTHDLIADIPDKLSFGTRTDRALIAANNTVFIPENGDRPDANNVLVVITDGRTRKGSAPYNVTVPPLTEGKNVKLLAFGVGPAIREEDLNEMVGENNWFYVEQFEEMKDRILDILQAACSGTPPGPVP